MRQKTFVINTADRISGTVNDFEHTIDAFANPIKTVYLESAQLYNTSYTINANNNQICWQIMTSGPLPALIAYYYQFSTTEYGYYSINDLINIVETKMNAKAQNGEVYTVSINSLTNQVIIDCDLSFDVTLLNTASTLWKRLGFTNFKLGELQTEFTDPYASFSFQGWPISGYSGNTMTASNTPRLSTNFYKLVITNLSTDTIDANTQTATAAIIPNNVTYGSMIDYRPYFRKIIEVPNMFSFYKISVKLLDDENNLAGVTTEFSFSMVADL